MRWIDGLSKAQQLVLVIALGLALGTLGQYLVGLGGGFGFHAGWIAYEQLQAIDPGPAPWLRMIIWLVLIAVWALASIRVLRPSPSQTGSD